VTLRNWRNRHCVAALPDMGPREEDNSLLLLGSVTLICGLIAFVPSLLDPTSRIAETAPDRISSKTVIQAGTLSPARVIVPFTPNTTPAQR